MITKNGPFEWPVMPFGLKNAINTSFKVLNENFRNELESFVKAFVDDLNIHSLDYPRAKKTITQWRENVTH